MLTHQIQLQYILQNSKNKINSLTKNCVINKFPDIILRCFKRNWAPVCGLNEITLVATIPTYTEMGFFQNTPTLTNVSRIKNYDWHNKTHN